MKLLYFSAILFFVLISAKAKSLIPEYDFTLFTYNDYSSRPIEGQLNTKINHQSSSFTFNSSFPLDQKVFNRFNKVETKFHFVFQISKIVLSFNPESDRNANLTAGIMVVSNFDKSMSEIYLPNQRYIFKNSETVYQKAGY